MAFDMKNREKLQKLLHTLGDSNRLRIIETIGNQETPVGAIVAATGLSQPLVSHHLKILKSTAVVATRRKGPFVYYRLSFPELLDVLGILADMVQHGDDAGPTRPMFQCPPWWGKMMHNMKENEQE
jgi:DNA-binding transcriptional ArsR family regulator